LLFGKVFFLKKCDNKKGNNTYIKPRQDFPMKIVILLVMAIAFIALLIEGQWRMIYYPRSYEKDLQLPVNCRALEFTTSQGKQQAYYLWTGRTGNEVPKRLWLLCGGNASLALDWLEILDGYPNHETGFLLLDYPGYGNSQGRAGPTAILESMEAALAELAVGLESDLGDVEEHLHLMGHSLGAAAVLLYAGQHRVKRIVLVSPFTSLKDMATLVVGKPLNRTLRHNYDNRARLREIIIREPELPITIFHGNHDKIIPVRMGRELAELSPNIEYREVANGDHNYILVTAREEIFATMVGQKSERKELGE
jgi:pimeloyl-ACP methyl ester carboxylesterase